LHHHNTTPHHTTPQNTTQSIVFLCVGSSFSFILGVPPEDHPSDAQLISFSKSVYDKLVKKYTSAIKKEELVHWAKENIFSRGCVSINDFLGVLKNGMESLEGQAKVDE
jgi:hypothetical protein